MKRRTTQPPKPTPTLDIATLQEQLRLSRAQCAYLHRELATALKQASLAATSFDGDDVNALMAENADLRRRLAILTRFHEALQRRCKLLESKSTRGHKDYQRLQQILFGRTEGLGEAILFEKEGRPGQATFVEEINLAQVLKTLLSVSYPDRRSRSQLALELAHELTVTVNELRARMGLRA
jgi:hypothetical protein